MLLLRESERMNTAHHVSGFCNQERLTAASGDRNPMHVDAALARRTQAGAPVVHGVHLLMWVMDSVAMVELQNSDNHVHRDRGR